MSELAQDTFVTMAREHAPDFPIAFIERLFLLQKSHQFDNNREMSVQALQRAIEDYVASLEKVQDTAS